MEFMMSQSCAIKDAVPLDGGGLYDIMIYKAKADGTVSIGWDLGSFALNNTKITKSLTAECQVVDDGQNILLSGDTRVTLVDSDTNEPLEFGADAGFALIDISTDTDNGGQVIAGIGSNPCILKNIKLPDEDKIGLRMPEGYTIPGQESSVSSAPEYMEHSLYPNGSGELIIRVKKEGGNDLPPGTARLTYIDKYTGEPIPTELLRNHPFTFGAEIVTAPDPDMPNARDYWDHVYTIDSNPYIIDEVLAERYSQAAEYQFWGNEKPAVTVYNNGSMDLVVTTKVRVSGNVNNDFDFNIADAVTLQNWLLGRPDAKLKNWAQADFTLDNQIDTFDLCIMRDMLIS